MCVSPHSVSSLDTLCGPALFSSPHFLFSFKTKNCCFLQNRPSDVLCFERKLFSKRLVAFFHKKLPNYNDTNILHLLHRTMTKTHSNQTRFTNIMYTLYFPKRLNWLCQCKKVNQFSCILRKRIFMQLAKQLLFVKQLNYVCTSSIVNCIEIYITLE